MQKVMKQMRLVILALLFCGCATTGGKDLDISSITKGVTTKTEVFNLLGAPDHETTLSDGTMFCMWMSVKVKRNYLMGALITKGIDNTAQENRNSVVSSETQTVQIRFSADGIVSSINSSRSGHI